MPTVLLHAELLQKHRTVRLPKHLRKFFAFLECSVFSLQLFFDFALKKSKEDFSLYKWMRRIGFSFPAFNN